MARGVVERLHVTVGYACSNSCLFCMENEEKRFKAVNRFVKDRVYEVLKKNTHIKNVMFTTGEPTLNPHLIEYIKYAKSLGYQEISLVSNGRRYKDMGYCLELIENGAREFVISVHGHNAKAHDTLTTAKGSFGETLQGLRNLSWLKKRLPIKIVVSHVVNKINYKHLGKFIDFMEEYPTDRIVLNIVQPRGNKMERRFFELMPKYEEVAGTLRRVFFREHRSFHEMVRRNLSVIDLPLCLSGEFDNVVGLGEKIILEKNNTMKNETFSAYKTKRKECHLCRYDNICPGIYRTYIKNYGWKEFDPVK